MAVNTLLVETVHTSASKMRTLRMVSANDLWMGHCSLLVVTVHHVDKVKYGHGPFAVDVICGKSTVIGKN